MSKVAHALIFKTCRSQTTPDQVELAGLTWQCGRQLWHSFLTWICAQIDLQVLVGHLIVIHWAADETPTKLTIADMMREMGLDSTEDGQAAPAAKDGKPRTAPRTVKLLQQDCKIAVVVSGSLTQFRPVIMDGSLCCPPYGMQSTNAECMSVGFQRTTDLAIMKQMVSRFRFIVRPTNLDRAGGCQRLVKNQCVLFPLSKSLPAPCYVHCSHTAARKACELQDADVSGMFSYIDSFENAGELANFRDILEQEIESEVSHGGWTVPSASSAQMIWKAAMLDALLPASSLNNVHRRHVLSTYISGEVGDAGLKHYGFMINKRRVREVVQCLVPRRIDHFQRGRWITDVDKIAEVALPFAYCPGATQRACVRFVKSAVKEARSDDPYRIDREESQVVVSARTGYDPDTVKREANKAAKISLLEWAMTSPGRRLVRLVVGMGPAARFCRVQLRIGSAEHQQRLMHMFCDGKNDAEVHQDDDNPILEYPWVAAASGRYCAVFWQSLELLFSDHQQWGAVPEPTREDATRAFAGLARNGGGVHTLISEQMRRYPHKFFRLLDPLDATAVDDIMNDCPELRDAFSRDFLEEFDTPAKLKSPLARAILAALARVMRLDTFPLECRFAFLKRISKVFGQTNTQTLTQHAACFVLARQRLLESTAGTKPAFSEITLPNVEGQAEAQRVSKVHKPGGSWRAWISRWLNTKIGAERLNFKQAAIEYGQLSMRGGPEWDKLVQEGRQATEASRAGGPAFAKGRSVDGRQLPTFSDPLLQALDMDVNADHIDQGHIDQPEAPEALVVQPDHNSDGDDLELYRLAEIARFQETSGRLAHQKAMADKSLVLRDAGRKLRQERAEMTERLESWADRARHEEWAQPFINQGCVARPSMYDGINHVEIVMPVTQMVKHVIERCGGGKAAKLAGELFQQDNAFIRTSSCNLQIPRNTKAEKTPCQEWGFCVCGERGKLVQYRLQTWKQAMHKVLQKDGALRKSYDAGLALLELTCASGEVAYVSLAFLNLTTKLGSLLHLVKDASASRQRQAEAFGCLSLEVRGHGEESFKTVHRTLRDLDLTQDWHAQELRAEINSSPISPIDFTPRIVVCTRGEWRIHLFGSTRGPQRQVGLLVRRPAKRQYPGQAPRPLDALADRPAKRSRHRVSTKQPQGANRTQKTVNSSTREGTQQIQTSKCKHCSGTIAKPGDHDAGGGISHGNGEQPGSEGEDVDHSEVGAGEPGSEEDADQSEVEDGGGHESCCSGSDDGLGADMDDDTVVELCAAGVSGLVGLSVGGVGAPASTEPPSSSASSQPDPPVVPARASASHIARPQTQARAGTHDRPDIGPGFHDIDLRTGLSYDCPGCACTRHCSHKVIGEQAAIARLLAWGTQCPGTTAEAHRAIGKRLLADFAYADP